MELGMVQEVMSAWQEPGCGEGAQELAVALHSLLPDATEAVGVTDDGTVVAVEGAQLFEATAGRVAPEAAVVRYPLVAELVHVWVTDSSDVGDEPTRRWEFHWPERVGPGSNTVRFKTSRLAAARRGRVDLEAVGRAAARQLGWRIP